jgi:hypothetical protein
MKSQNLKMCCCFRFWEEDMKRILGLTAAVALLILPSAWAGTASRTVPINATTLNACVVSPNNLSPSLDLDPDYDASVNYGITSQASVSIAVFCNKLTPISLRSLVANTTTTTPGTAGTVLLTLAKQSPLPLGDTINVRVWFTVGTTTTPFPGPGFVGSSRYLHTLFAGWLGNQFAASSGFYSGSMQFTVTF